MSSVGKAATQPARPLGRPPKSQDQRERILREAARAFANIGYEQCSIAIIAKELDLSPPALYHYFPTKQSIFTEIAMTSVKGIYDFVLNELDKEQSFGLQLHQMMTAHARYYEDNYWMMNAVIVGYGGTSRREIEHISEFEAYRQRYEKLLLTILRGGVKSGEFRKVDVKSTARSILQLLNITRWYQPGGSKRAVDIAAENFDLIYRSLVDTNVNPLLINKGHNDAQD